MKRGKYISLKHLEKSMLSKMVQISSRAKGYCKTKWVTNIATKNS
jgi:hypothetical protein